MKLAVMAGLVILIINTIMARSGEGSVLEKVGSRKGWIPNFNYTQWSTNHHFYVGDWLLFVFEKRYYNVLEVNKTSYQGCEEKGFVRNITKGGRDVVELTEARPYYFISGGGYCWGGMKVAVNVEPQPIPAPAPAPAPNSHANRAVALPADYYHVARTSCVISIIIIILWLCSSPLL